MAVSYVGVGSLGSAATGNVTPGLPASLTDNDATTGVADLMFCVISTNSNVASTMPAGWTLFQQQASSTTLQGTIFWKRYAAGDTAPLVTHNGGTNNTTAARIIAFRGVNGTGNGMAGNTQGTHWQRTNNTANTTAHTAGTLTPSSANNMIVYVGAGGEEAAHATYTGTSPSGATLLANEAFDDGVTLGSDTGLWGTYGLQTTATATGSISSTASITCPYVAWLLALEPAATVASYSQVAFRGRNDDGNETTATWKATQNTNWTQNTEENFRLRFEIQSDATSTANAFKLQYNKNSAGWNDVNASSSNARSSASPNLADGAATTNQLTAGTGTFTAGTFDEVDGAVASVTVAASGHTEFEFAMQLRAADVTAGDTIQFRIVKSNGTAITTYSQTPTVTVAKPTRQTPTAQISLGSLVTPDTGTQTLTVRARKAGSTQAGVLRVQLYEGATQRSTADHTLTDSFQNFTQTPSGITNYSNLELRVQGIGTAGYQLVPEVSWAKFEIPAAPALTSSETRDVRVVGQAEDSTTRDVRVTGEAPTSNETRDVRVTGQAESSLATDVRVNGAGQVLRPIADDSAGAWITAPLYQKIDEVSPSDADYISTTSSSTAEFSLTSGSAFVADNAFVRYRIGKDGASTVNFTVTLLQGTTQIGQWTHNNVAQGFTTYEQTLTQGEKDAITDPTNLKLRIAAVIS